MILRRLSGKFTRKKEVGQQAATGKDTSRPPVLQTQPSLNNQALLGDEFATMGVSLAYLRALDIPENAGFQVVRDEIVKMTRGTRTNRSLASFLLQNSKTKHLVGKANCFVSYAWSGGFGATMRALSKHFEHQPDPFVWMDVAMVDQHAAANTNVDFDVWSRTFKLSLKQIGKAVLVLTPAQDPIAITRSWCCFEWASIKQAGIPFEYCVTQEDVEGLIERMEGGMESADFINLFAGINVEKATAFKKSDAEAILQLMREIGVKEVNDIIMFSLKDWLLRVVTEAEKRVKDCTKEGVCLLNAKAALHFALGEFEEALPLWKQALTLARQVPNNVDILVADLLSNLAGLSMARGDYDVAEPLVREAIGIFENAFGRVNLSVARSLNNLGGLLQLKGNYDGAEGLHREALEVRKEILGDTSPDVVNSLNNLAGVLREKGDYAGAESISREAIAIGEKIFGRDHPSFATCLNNLAGLLEMKGDFSGAVPLYLEALAVDRRTLGDAHPDVATDLNNVAGLMSSMGEYDGAEFFYRESLSIRKKALGDAHPDVATVLNNLSEILMFKGDYGGAEALCREALAISKNTLGDSHPDVATWLNNLALNLLCQNKKMEAIRLGREALSIRKRALGLNHPDTIQAQKSWGA